MIYFLIAATILLYICILFVLPSINKSSRAANNQHEANLNAYDQKVAELEKDRLDEQIDTAEFALARIELDRQLIEDEKKYLKKNESLAVVKQYQLISVLLISLPAISILLYLIFAYPEAIGPRTPQNSYSPAPHATNASSTNSAIPKGKMPDIGLMIIRVENRVKKNPEKISDWHLLASSYNYLGQFDKAAKAMAEIVKRQPKNVKAKARHQEFLAKSKNSNITINPNTIPSKPMPGQTIPSAGVPKGKMPDVNAMIARVEKRVKDKPDNISDRTLLVRSYVQLKQYNKAAKAIAEIVKRQPNNANAIIRYADLLAAANSMRLSQKSVILLNRGLKIQPNHQMGLFLLGKAHFQNRKFKQAQKVWLKLEKLATKNSMLGKLVTNALENVKLELKK